MFLEKRATPSSARKNLSSAVVKINKGFFVFCFRLMQRGEKEAK